MDTCSKTIRLLEHGGVDVVLHTAHPNRQKPEHNAGRRTAAGIVVVKSVAPLPDTEFRDAVRSLRSSVAGIQAIVLIGPDGVVLEYLAINPHFDIGMFAAEYATLLRIARRASEDTGFGELSEHISISERTIVLARSFLTGFCLVLVSDVQAQVGRARYELKVAAQLIERAMRK